MPVRRLLVNPCPGFMAVMFLLRVSATRRAHILAPTAVVIPTTERPVMALNAGPKMSTAAIFGVSFSPRTKLTIPDDRKWAPTRAKW